MPLLLATDVMLRLAHGGNKAKAVVLPSVVLKSQIFVSVISVGMIRFTIDSLPNSARKAQLHANFHELLNNTLAPTAFRPVTIAVARRWAELCSYSLPVIESGSPREMEMNERLVLATAMEHNLELVTGNHPWVQEHAMALNLTVHVT